MKNLVGFGKCRGNMAIKNANIPIVVPRMIQPSHQAPNHRGSSLLIIGCKVGSMYKLRQVNPKMNPPTVPDVLRANKIPGKNVCNFINNSDHIALLIQNNQKHTQ